MEILTMYVMAATADRLFANAFEGMDVDNTMDRLRKIQYTHEQYGSLKWDVKNQHADHVKRCADIEQLRTTGSMCSVLGHWSLVTNYYGTSCHYATQVGCDNSLNMVLESVERTLETDPAQIAHAGGTMAGVLEVFAGTTNRNVIRHADTTLALIKAYTPTPREQAVHTTLVADYEEFVRIARRAQKVFGQYNGDPRSVVALRRAMETAAKHAAVHQIDYYALCPNTGR